MTLLLSCMWPNFRPFPSVWLNSSVIYSEIHQNCSNSVESKPNYDFQTNIIKWWRYKDYAFFIKQTGVYSKDAVRISQCFLDERLGYFLMIKCCYYFSLFACVHIIIHCMLLMAGTMYIICLLTYLQLYKKCMGRLI